MTHRRPRVSIEQEAGGEEVLHPLHVRAIGQEKEVLVASLEDVIGVR
jgi:hypothetical protein